MKIAIVGTRGIPAAYGGFETLAWELGTRLAARGHDVTIYCRMGRTDESIPVPPGIHRRFLPYLPGKYLETVSHTSLSILDSLLRDYDAMWIGNAANAVFAGLPRLRGTKVALNVDGIERQRSKWGIAGRLWYALGERLALILPNVIVADAEVIRAYYRERYEHDSVVIAYGAPLLDRSPAPDLARHGLDEALPDRYFLYVSRLEPENQADLVIRAYRDVPGELPLLVVGDAPYAERYKRSLRDLAALDPRVRLTGAIYGAGYRDLQRGALAYIQATSVGGTHPALIEAMGAGNLVLAFSTPENVEVLGGTGLLFEDSPSLAAHLTRIVADPHAPAFETLRSRAKARAKAVYSWDAVTAAYERLFAALQPDEKIRALDRRPSSARRTLGRPITFGASGVGKRLSAFERLVPFAGGRILDVGCGNGAYTLELANRFAEVVAIDVERGRLSELTEHAAASAHSAQIDAREMSAEAMQFEDASFDAVTAIEVLEHVNDVQRAVGEIGRVVRPGGYVYVSVPNRRFPLETHAVRIPGFGEFDGRRLPFLPYLRPLHRRVSTASNFSEREITELFAAAGLELAGLTHVMPPFDHWAFGRRILKPLTERLERSIVGRAGVSIIAVFRKPEDGRAVPGITGVDAAAAITTIDIIDLGVHNVSFAETVNLIARWAREGSGGYVYTPNVDDVVKARLMPEFRDAVRGARLRVPDGMGIVYGSRILGTPLKGTVTGRLLPAAVAAALGGKPPGIAFFGGRPEVVAGAARAITARGGLVSTAIAPSMNFEIGSPEDVALTSELRSSGAGVVFVSLGAPRQAIWMARHTADLPNSVLVGVGAAVDVLAGRVSAAPVWMTRVGLEWLYRLLHEPRRLARRYLVDDPRFFLWVLGQRFRRR